MLTQRDTRHFSLIPITALPTAVAMLTLLNTTALTTGLKAEAARRGFTLCGVTAAVTPEQAYDRLQQWLAAGYAGEMRYIGDRLAAYADPQRVLDGARSVVMLGFPYRTEEPQTPQSGQGRISRYAWGEADYHDVIHERLKQLGKWFAEQVPLAKTRGIVDSAPLLEREFAQLAGLGWIGKNTLLLNRTAGSWFFLAALLTDVELEYDAPFTADHCGTCTACLDACPTQAFPAPHVLDATRCISYLTIELRDEIPLELREGLGDWVFGCDVCQDVCPWNRRSPPAAEELLRPRPDSNPVDLIALFDLTDEAFRVRFRRTPLWRSKRRGILRNAALVLGNQRCAAALPALRKGLGDADAVVREAAAWAVARIESAAS
jgi:epoxyqueuosine reductase